MKKSIWALVASIMQLVIGTLAIAAFIILAVNGEEITKWIPALFLSVAFVILGIMGIKSKA